MPAFAALEGGNPDSEDEASKASRLAARQARFGQKLQGNRFKELEAARIAQRKAFEDQGLISSGKTELDDAIDMKGTCETMCTEYEREGREFKQEVNIFEASANDRRRMDPEKAVAAYTRSDAGAGHGAAAVLPSDLRTPATLVKTLDYLVARIMTSPPPSASGPSTTYNARKALGYSAGFIRDRTRAIRKEFAMQSSWGHEEAIATFERIARWHILCLRELQEESGTNTDMHIDSAELGRCFTSLRQQYNDRREETGLELPCSNEPEFRAYMLIFDLTSKSVAIPTAELPAVILDHPLVKLAWQIRAAAQRNFDSQKEGSKNNAELGMNLITRFVRLLKQVKVPYLLSCLVEIRLREMRRSAIRALTRTYPRLKSEPIRLNEAGEVIELRMILIKTLDRIMGCEELETVESAWDDVMPTPKEPGAEVVNIVEKFNLEVYFDEQNGEPMGSLINLGSPFNDNEDAPFTRRWKYITDKRGDATYQQIVNGQAGVHIDGTGAPIPLTITKAPSVFVRPAMSTLNPQAPAFSFMPAKPTPSPAEPQAQYTPTPFAPPARTPPVQQPLASQPSAPLAPAAPAAAKPVFSFGLDKPAIPAPVATTKPVGPAPSFSFPPAIPSPLPEASKVTAPAPSPITIPTPLDPIMATAQASSASQPRPSPARTSIAASPMAALPSPLRASVRRPYLTDAERARRQHALPFVRDILINEVVDQILSDITPELLTIVKREAAAKAHVRAKAKRQELIEQCSTQVLETVLREHVERLTAEALADEVYDRNLVKKTLRHWRDWARQSRIDREQRQREREQTLGRLSSMGLGGASLGVAERGFGGSAERDELMLDELETDVGLHDTKRTKESFYRPSTFFTAIARHVSPMINTVTTASTQMTFESTSHSHAMSSTRSFRTVLSSARDSASPPKSIGSDWLDEKLAAPHEPYDLDGVDFETSTVGRYDELPTTADIGLCVFETPLKTLSSSSAEENIADAQDRLAAIAELIDKQTVMYEPALLLVSWDGETLEEIVERLDLSESVAFFGQVSVLSLEYMEDLDGRFATALEEALPMVKQKEQVIVELYNVFVPLAAAWNRLNAVIDLVSRQPLSNGDPVLLCFDAGIQAINELSKAIKSAVGKAKIDGDSPLGPPLPSFGMPIDDVSLMDAAEAIVSYFSENIIEGADEARLVAVTLHRAAHAQTGGALPIANLLQVLMSAITTPLANQQMALRVWLRDEAAVQKYLETLTLAASKRYDVSISALVGRLSRSLPSPAPVVTRKPSTSTSPKMSTASAFEGFFTPVKRSSFINLNGKRVRGKDGEGDENSPPAGETQTIAAGLPGFTKRESKSLKTRRLMKALESVRTTLATIRAREEADDGDEVEDDDGEDEAMQAVDMVGRRRGTLLFT